MFSVIIPLYNKEKHIKETIDSVLNQTFQEFEIIVVDDGSTDGGAEKVKKIGSDNIQLIRQKNQGVSVARNRGAGEAKYDYLVFLDADDGLMPEYLAGIKSLIEEFPEAGIYATNLFIHKQSTGELIPKKKPFLPEKSIVDDYFYHLAKDRTILGCVSTIRKDVFINSGGYVEGMIRGEDTYLLTKIMLKEKLSFLNEPLYYYTIGSDNQVTSGRYKPSRGNASLLDFFGEGDIYADQFIILYSTILVKKLIKNGYNKEAVRIFGIVKSEAPDNLKNLVESYETEVESMLSTPGFYYSLRRIFINEAIKLNERFKLFRKKMSR